MSTIRQTPDRAAVSYRVLGAASVCHMLNDTMQSLFVAAYPIFKGNFHLSFTQIGVLTLVFNLTASLLQPLVGLYTDRKPQPYSLPFGMAISMSGLFTLAFATQYAMLLLGGALLGVGSSIFHPETSRLARLASGGSHGLAQSVFQVGGNFGSSLGPLLMIFLVLPHGQHSLAWFSLAAMVGIVMQVGLARWYQQHGHAIHKRQSAVKRNTLSRNKVFGAIAVLVVLTFSKYFYLVSITSYYVFYLMQHFHLPEKQSQLYLFLFLAALAAGTVAGGPVGDRIGRKKVIWLSILGVLPMTLLLALCFATADRRPEHADRLHHRLGVLGDPGLRAGTGAESSRHDLGAVLRTCLRHGRLRGRSPRHIRRPHQHRLSLQGVRVPARARPLHGFLARPDDRRGYFPSDDHHTFRVAILIGNDSRPASD